MIWILGAALAWSAPEHRGHAVQAVGVGLAAAGLAASGGFASLRSDLPVRWETGGRVGQLLWSAGAPVVAHGTLLTRHHRPDRDTLPHAAGGIAVALGAGAVLATLGAASARWDDDLGWVGVGMGAVAYGAATLQGLQMPRRPPRGRGSSRPLVTSGPPSPRRGPSPPVVAPPLSYPSFGRLGG